MADKDTTTAVEPLNIRLRLRQKSDFLARFLPDVGIGGYQWDGPKTESGVKVRLDISFIGFQETFQLTGRVVWGHSRPPMKPDLAEGVGIEFDSACRKDLQKIVSFVTLDSDTDALRRRDDRREARLRVRLECDFLHERKLVHGHILNVSEHGMFIESEHVLVEDTQFLFFLDDKEYIRPHILEARVIWASVSDGEPGFGVQLLFDSRKHKRDIQGYIRELGAALDDL